jgi:DNA primase
VALQKLAVHAFPGDESTWREEFLGALAQLDKQTRQQRVDELNARIAEVGMTALSDSEKAELRELQTARR